MAGKSKVFLVAVALVGCGLVTAPARDGGAGGSTAGGSTAGGSTAGGSTAGGSTAGGSAAGGSTAGGSASDAGVALLQWEVDGGVIATLESFESGRFVSMDNAFVFLPLNGRSVQMWFSHVSDAGLVSMDCAQTSALSMTLGTGDNTWAGIRDKLPLEWQNLIFTSCTTSTGDTVERYHLEADVTPQRIAGSFEVRVRGGGVRAGSTLRVSGTFDVVPKPQ